MLKKAGFSWFVLKTFLIFTLLYGIIRNIKIDVFIYSTYTTYHTREFALDKQTPDNKICSSVEEAVIGSWVYRKNLTSSEIDERKKVDAKIRVDMDWPASMVREDNKCGKQNLIPGYRLQGQCDPYSSTPCCNQEQGLCGNGDTYCKCNECTDLRTMIPAELAVWAPLSGCTLRGLTHEESCDLLINHKARLAFIGDSLIRHLHTMMLLVLTNDFRFGSIPLSSSYENKKLCEGESQITLKKCSIEIVAQKTEEISNSSLCNGRPIQIDLVQDYHTVLIPEVESKINELFEQENTWIIGGIGLHYQLNFDLCKSRYLDRVWNQLNSSRNGWPKLIWIEIHGTFGFLRQDIGPINKNVVSFNQKVNQYWRDRRVQVIETFNISKGLRSYDGRHYGIGFNKLKVQLIFNYLHMFYSNQQKQKQVT